VQVNKHGIPVHRDPVVPPACPKDLYASEAAARAVAVQKQINLRAYHCARCQSWHLTRQVNPESPLL